VISAAAVWIGPTKIFPPLLIIYLFSGPVVTLLRRRTPSAKGEV
jgi:hypothetical protein